jgi:hypothetical protein
MDGIGFGAAYQHRPDIEADFELMTRAMCGRMASGPGKAGRGAGHLSRRHVRT